MLSLVTHDHIKPASTAGDRHGLPASKGPGEDQAGAAELTG
jgi:hypothetical protein